MGATVAVRYFETARGERPVHVWFFSECSKADRKVIGEDLRFIQVTWPVGMPRCRALGQGLYEVRSNLANNRIARVFFGFVGGTIVLLHGIVKKTQKTPAADLEIARERFALAKKG